MHDILDFSVLKNTQNNFTKNATVFDVQEAINEIVEMQIDKINMKEINFKISYLGFFGSNFRVKTDQRRLQQVFLNLISNAVKFTDKKGQIQVLVENRSQLNLQACLEISVTDNGIGIKEENQSKLFQLFSTFKDTTKQVNLNGIGLGLVICKLIVKKFDGYIDFVSREGEATTFFFSFSLEDDLESLLQTTESQLRDVS